MKLHIVLVFGLLCLAALSLARPANEDYAEYEDEPAPPPKKPVRNSLIGRRNPIVGKSSKASSTTPAPAAEAAEEVEEPIEEEPAEEAQEQPSSTTETSKKFIKSGVVRPFRSNDDLLATLKRRRQQVASNKQNSKNQASDAEESAPAPVHNEPAGKSPSRVTSGGRKRFNNSKNSEPAPAVEEASSTAATARTGRRFNTRS